MWSKVSIESKVPTFDGTFYATRCRSLHTNTKQIPTKI